MPRTPSPAPIPRRAACGGAFALAAILLSVPVSAEGPQTALAGRDRAAAADVRHQVSGIPGLDGSPSDLDRGTPGLSFDPAPPAAKPALRRSRGVTGIPGPGAADAARLSPSALVRLERSRGVDAATAGALAELGGRTAGGLVTADATAD